MSALDDTITTLNSNLAALNTAATAVVNALASGAPPTQAQLDALNQVASGMATITTALTGAVAPKG